MVVSAPMRRLRAVFLDAGQAGNLLDVYQRAWFFLEFYVDHNVGAAGDDLGFGAMLGQQRQCVADGFWFKIFHGIASLWIIVEIVS